MYSLWSQQQNAGRYDVVSRYVIGQWDYNV